MMSWRFYWMLVELTGGSACEGAAVQTKFGMEVPMRIIMVILAVLSLGGTAVAQAPQQQMEAPKLDQVEKIALGTGVETRELVGEATEFDVSVGRIYCWTKIISQTVPTTIKHVWYADAEQAAEVTLNVQYPSTRTWSSKVIRPGKWRVDVLGETGEVLATTDFTVTAQPGPAGP
jgi:DUF2914 family protein